MLRHRQGATVFHSREEALLKTGRGRWRGGSRMFGQRFLEVEGRRHEQDGVGLQAQSLVHARDQPVAAITDGPEVLHLHRSSAHPAQIGRESRRDGVVIGDQIALAQRGADQGDAATAGRQGTAGLVRPVAAGVVGAAVPRPLGCFHDGHAVRAVAEAEHRVGRPAGVGQLLRPGEPRDGLGAGKQGNNRKDGDERQQPKVAVWQAAHRRVPIGSVHVPLLSP